ncbi:hypothetical protein NQZ68_016164 [Dissostichus eleginoides]|nr:hypothetical protein NQZ68_016164 [Dissostichus eleginoides]
MDGRYNNPQVSEPEVAYAGNGYDSNAQVVSYGSSASTDVGDGLSSEPEPVFSEVAGLEPVFSEVAGLEPVFSEVAGLEPVYSFSSRSRYQRERSQVAQTRYIPGEPVPRPMPLPRRNSNPRESAAANAPTKEAAAPRFMHWPPPSNYGYWGRGASSDPGSSSHLPGVPVPRSNKAPELPVLHEASSSAGPGNFRASDFYHSPNMAVVKDDYASLRDERYNSPVVREPEVAYVAYRYDTSAPEDNVGSYYNLKDASWMVGRYNNPQVSEPEVAYAGNGYDTSAPENNVGSYYNLKDASWMDGRYNNPQVSEPEVAYAGNGYDSNAQVVSYGSSASTDVGDGLSSEPEPVFSEVAGLEPVFSEVAGLEPVYSFSSRSRYQRERSQVAKTRYIPGEPVPRPMPLPRRNSNPRESAAANAPTKVVF